VRLRESKPRALAKYAKIMVTLLQANGETEILQGRLASQTPARQEKFCQPPNGTFLTSVGQKDLWIIANSRDMFILCRFLFMLQSPVVGTGWDEANWIVRVITNE
jgi:hypothetical protein